MDLVSSTLDKYLKHRFNGNRLKEGSASATAGPAKQEESQLVNHNDDTSNNIVPTTKNNNNISDNIKTETMPSVIINSTKPDNSSTTTTTNTNNIHQLISDNEETTVNKADDFHDLKPSSLNNNLAHKTSIASNDINTEQQYLFENDAGSPPSTSTNLEPSIKQPNSKLGHNNNHNNKQPLTNGYSTTETSKPPYVDAKMPKINQILIYKVQPCCVSLKDDLKYLAAGFEDSHIYLWSLKTEFNQDGQTAESDIEGDNKSYNVDKLYTLLAHTGPVYSIRFLNNTDLMLSCSEDTTIRLWCLKEKCNVFVYRGHNYPVWSLDIGPLENSFASTSMDTTARLWRFDRMSPIRIFCGHDDDVECVKFHPNEKYLATGSSDSTIRLWSISDGKMVRLMVGHQNPIISLSFHSNGKFLTSASRDGIIKIWNLATNSVTNEFNSISPSYTISFSPEQVFISSCGIDKVLRLYQLMNEQSMLIEKKSLDFQSQETNLIQSQFHTTSNRLFIFRYSISNHGQDSKAKTNNSAKPMTSTTTTTTTTK